MSHDILGNRTQYGSTSYAWDALNRLTSLTASSVTTNYEYRADGMRTHKSSSSGYTEYYHDGQMPMEEAVFSGGSFTVTRYGIGARGMDYMEVGTASTRPTSYSNVGFPIYDAHGNMIATLARSGGSYAVDNQRSYDAWGVVRQGAATGDPKNRYCANLGHHQDDESGLIYMRARYYEPGSGRFVSEDPGTAGSNLFIYALNNPVCRLDFNGKDAIDALIESLYDCLSAPTEEAACEMLDDKVAMITERIGKLEESFMQAYRDWLKASSAAEGGGEIDPAAEDELLGDSAAAVGESYEALSLARSTFKETLRIVEEMLEDNWDSESPF